MTDRHILTLVAARRATALTHGQIDLVCDAIGGGEVTVLSPGEAIDIDCPVSPDLVRVRAVLSAAPIDAIATPADRRRKRLLIADMDSTIITGETLDELAVHAGLGAEIAAITARAMNGELDFEAALRARVAMLKGLSVEALERTWQSIRLTEGARTLIATMRTHGAFTALVSGGFTFFTSRVAAGVGFDLHRSNVLLDDGHALTGRVAEPILGRTAKLETLRELVGRQGLQLEDSLAVGDGANDLDMLQAAGLGVAFHAKPIVAAAARAEIRHADLRALLFAQGYPVTSFVDEA